MITIDDIFVINLRRRVDRLQHIEHEFSKSTVLHNHYKIFDAVDGRDLDLNSISTDLVSQESIDKLKQTNDRQFGLDLTPGSVGILYTHLHLYEQCIENNHTYLVFEDDAKITDTFDYHIKKIQRELPDDFDFCYLGYQPGSSFTTEPYSKNLRIPFNQINGSHGFLISPKGAKTILSTFPVDYQLDTHLYLNFKIIKAYCSYPSIVTIETFTSDVQI